ncbi:MAG: aminotransferase IV [Planctomycetota bacterium]|nr:MAG: aminotransferase IV [Planctomycetota bacterium]
MTTPQQKPIALANMNGEITPLSEAKIPALDRGFLFGDAVYEVMWVNQGKMWLEKEHFIRLERSLNLIRIQGVDLVSLAARVYETITAGKFKNAIVYIQITRGAAPRSHAFPKDVKPFEFLFVQEFNDPYGEMREKGIHLLSRPDIRWEHCDIKSTNLLANVLAIQDSKEAGCQEVLFYLKDGTITESAHSSLFGVLDGILYTSPSSDLILPGITRNHLLNLIAKDGIPIREKSLQMEQLGQISELFITGTTSGVLPVVAVDKKNIGDGKPGPITRKIEKAYWDSVKTWNQNANHNEGS